MTGLNRQTFPNTKPQYQRNIIQVEDKHSPLTDDSGKKDSEHLEIQDPPSNKMLFFIITGIGVSLKCSSYALQLILNFGYSADFEYTHIFFHD